MFVPITPCWGKRLITHLFILVLPIQGAWGWGHLPKALLWAVVCYPFGAFLLDKDVWGCVLNAVGVVGI